MIIQSAVFGKDNSIINATFDGLFMSAPKGHRFFVEAIRQRDAGAITIEGYETPSATDDEIIAERERRLALGFDYDFGDERDIHHFAMTEADMQGWDDVTKNANALLALGQVVTTIDIVTETGPVSVTALEWQAIIIAASQARQPIWHASFELQKMTPDDPENPRPSSTDMTNDIYWT